MIKQVLSDKLVIYKNAIPNPEELIKEFEETLVKFDYSWTKAVINDFEYNNDLRSCTIFSLFVNESDDSEWAKAKVNLNQKINKFVSEAFLDYCKTYGYKVKSKEPWEICRYEETQKLVWHTDDGPTHPCDVSFVIYFNDDYEGGDIQFKEHLDGYPYKPPAGSIIIFPSKSTHVHRVIPITKGVKYAAISFAK
jgi:hypothetical protein